MCIAILSFCSVAWMYLYNNYSLRNNHQFEKQFDEAIDNATEWVRSHREDILDRKNIALLRMLQDASELHQEPLFDELVDEFLASKLRPDCWKRLLNREHPVRYYELNQAIKQANLDNKWILHAIATEKAKLTDEELAGLFDGDRWQGRKLTHQLWALVHLRDRSERQDRQIDELISHIADRLAGQLRFDTAVVDIYLQKIAFVLMAGHPEKINRRWVERVIENQSPDGGWDDRWYCFTSRRRPRFESASPSDQHATAQGLWLLYQVKYRYPEEFGLAE